MVQVGRRTGQAGRQSVRDRDRQGFDGSAVDHHRRARRDPRSGRRCRAGRRHRRRDRGRIPCPAEPTGRINPATAIDRKASFIASGNHGSSAGCAAPAGFIAHQTRSIFRGAHTLPQFRHGAAVRRRHDHPAGTPARRRISGSICRGCAAPAPMAASSRTTSKPRRGRRTHRLPRARVPAPTRSRRCSRRMLTKKCRSTGCAAPSPRG